MLLTNLKFQSNEKLSAKNEPKISRQVMVDVEVQKKAGFSLQPEEEQLRVQLESIQQELNAPNLFKVCGDLDVAVGYSRVS